MDRKEYIEKSKKEAEERKKDRIQRIIKALEEMKPFTEYYIPEPPIVDKEIYEKHVIPNFIRCGAIPTEKLIKGKTYIGSCRNADEAVWDGEKFTYQRTKFGITFPEEINNFDNDDGYDLFVAIKEKDEA